MRIMICSGAGLSAESGIATFRDSGGLWENFKVEEVCDITTFEENYIKVNEFYDDRRSQLSRVEPNSAHIAIAELCKHQDVINYTTNVDDLLERAGCPDVKHIHGNLLEVVHNYGTDTQIIVPVGYDDPSGFEDLSLYPVKPNVVFFGEHAPMYQELVNDMTDLTPDDLLIVVGSSEQVVSFVDMARVTCQFKGSILFVNNDIDLVGQQMQMYCVLPFASTATNFFTKIDNLLENI